MDCMAGPSSVSRHDPCTRQPPINHITVSKKRNWLQQSSARPVLHTEDFTSPSAAEVDLTPPQTHPPSGPGPFSETSSHLRRPNVKPSQTSSHPPRWPDPAEENDADDEGEIWYNPIPEDEEADLPRCIPKIRVGQTEPSLGASGRRATGENLGGEGGCRETPHTSASYSSETSQLHRQMFACKTQEENISVRATGTCLSLSISCLRYLSISVCLSLFLSAICHRISGLAVFWSLRRLFDVDVVVPVVLMSTCHQTGV